MKHDDDFFVFIFCLLFFVFYSRQFISNRDVTLFCARNNCSVDNNIKMKKEKNIVSWILMGQIVSAKMILVICQRKGGLSSNIGLYKNVKNTVVPIIESLATEMLSSGSHVTHYLSDLSGLSHLQTKSFTNEVDFDLILDHDSNNEKGKKFIDSHQQYYDLVVLKTCPFRLILYDILFGLLKHDGLVVFSAINNNGVAVHLVENSLYLPLEFHRYFF